MSFYQGSVLIDFERFLIQVFNKVKDQRSILRDIVFRRDDEVTHKVDNSVVLSVVLEDGVQLESLSPDNFIFTYASRFSFYKALGFTGNLFKRTAVYDPKKVPQEEFLWVADYEKGKVSFIKLALRSKKITLLAGENRIPKPSNYYPESAQLWFRGAKEEAALLGENEHEILFNNSDPAPLPYTFKWLENLGESSFDAGPSQVYYDTIVPGVVVETSEFLEEHDRVLLRLTLKDDPVYDVFGGLFKCKVRLKADPLNEVNAKRFLGNLLSLTFEVQKELWALDVPVNNIQARTVLEDADLSKDRARKPQLDFDTQFQYEYFVPIQRYLRDIRVASIQELEMPTRVLYLRGDSI